MLIYTIMGYDDLFPTQEICDNCVPVCTRLSVRQTQTSNLLKNVIQNKKKMLKTY